MSGRGGIYNLIFYLKNPFPVDILFYSRVSQEKKEEEKEEEKEFLLNYLLRPEPDQGGEVQKPGQRLLSGQLCGCWCL